ncbi:hypothetical protein SLEP1_g44826 [Rubroshorea leprosula]|uniref:Uncharacterized protein n=1 Tax=Rubroshorea leprosula TaxID=152421 RepID=A0AAV5LJ40_9ROSI|nr:hypothetical protein SLEP1_g44826 [Rubroshorea leprosula]
MEDGCKEHARENGRRNMKALVSSIGVGSIYNAFNIIYYVAKSRSSKAGSKSCSRLSRNRKCRNPAKLATKTVSRLYRAGSRKLSRLF